MHLIQDMIARIDAIPATQEPKAAPQEGQSLDTFPKGSQAAPAIAAPDSGEMPEEGAEAKEGRRKLLWASWGWGGMWHVPGYGGDTYVPLTWAEARDITQFIDALCAYALSLREREGRMVTERQIDLALRARIPGGSNAEDWFLPHESKKAKANIRDVVKAMLSAAPPASPAGPDK